MPQPFLHDASLGGWLHEKARELFRRASEFNPALRRLARTAAACVAVTPATAERLHALGAAQVVLLSQVGLSREDLKTLAQPTVPSAQEFLYAGNLIFLKGLHLGLRAFAAADLPEWTFRILGDGPERARLENLADRLGIADRVVFEGRIPRDLLLKRMVATGVLVHPSLHDSGGFTCLEAMAAGKPVICLNLGGPAMQVTPETGIRVEAITPTGVVQDMAMAMHKMALDPKLRQQMGDAGRVRAQTEFSWERKTKQLNDLYHRCIGSAEAL
jgi:glycosyltransferase involved in cell wall biosynthesis